MFLIPFDARNQVTSITKRSAEGITNCLGLCEQTAGRIGFADRSSRWCGASCGAGCRGLHSCHGTIGLSEKQKSSKTETAKIPPISGSPKFASILRTTIEVKELARDGKETGINFPSAPIAKKKPVIEEFKRWPRPEPECAVCRFRQAGHGGTQTRDHTATCTGRNIDHRVDSICRCWS